MAIKRWFLVNFVKVLQGHHFVVGGPKTFKLLADITFENSLQNTDDIPWNEVVTSTARTFNNSWPLHLTFSNINLCPNILFIKNSKCQQSFLEKGAAKKKPQIFHIFKGLLFCNGWPIDMNIGVFWETSVGFLKSVILQLFPKYSQSNVN